MEYIGIMQNRNEEGPGPKHLFFVRAKGPTSEDAIRQIQREFERQTILALSPLPQFKHSPNVRLSSGNATAQALHPVEKVPVEFELRATHGYMMEVT